MAAWRAACRVVVPRATVLLPPGHRFLVSPVTLQGPCSTRLTLQVDGALLAPPGMDSWPRSRRPLQWLNFKWLNGFTVQGAGTVDGRSITSLQDSSSPADAPHQVIVSYTMILKENSVSSEF